MTVAFTMIQQLGGVQIYALAFDRHGTTFDDSSLTLKIAPSLVQLSEHKATHVHITLDLSDTYTVKLMKFGKNDVVGTVLEEYSDIYCDQLREIVEKMTGLVLTFHRFVSRARNGGSRS